MAAGPCSIEAFKKLSSQIVEGFFLPGGPGIARQHRAFNNCENGVVVHEGFAGRQGMSTGIATAMEDLKGMGCDSEGMLVWHTTELSNKKRRLIEGGKLAPKHSFANAKLMSLSDEEMAYMKEEKPKADGAGKIDDDERCFYHHRLHQHFIHNPASSKSRR